MKAIDFISFFDARKFLTKKFGKEPSYAEFWMWCYFGKAGDGIDVYCESDREFPNKEYEKYQMQSSQLVMFKNIKIAAKGIKQFWFLYSEIESFNPVDRFITADELIKKWTSTLDNEEEAKDYIKCFARDAFDWEDNKPILRNQYCGAYSPTTKAFEPLNGVYSETDVLAVEKHCHMGESRNEVFKDDGQGDTERESTKVIQANNNDVEFSELLNIPKKADDWFYAIDAMTLEFYKRYKKIPSETQAWGRLWTSPPDGYTITTGIDRREDCLNMPGARPLSKSAFSKRWAKYTADKPQ